MHKSPFAVTVSEQVWRTKYRWSDKGHMQEPSVEASWDRVALAVSGVEPHHRNDWRERFRAILGDFRFLPGGRILAGAGTTRQGTLFNCFVLGPLEDSINGIFNALREAMVTLQAGGGVGVDFSTLRPVNTAALRTGSRASGPVSFLQLWEAANSLLETGNLRRGAMMATLRCDHPDIEAFVQCKAKPGLLAHFNLSVLVSDDFMHAVEEDKAWPLVFPLGDHPLPADAEVCERVWSGSALPQPCRVYRRVPARQLWDHMLAAMHSGAEPGVLFVDRINRVNNLWYAEQLSSTNPCGEVPLPPSGACNLGSINLTRFVQHPFSPHPAVDFPGLRAVAAVATRFLDDVYELSLFPLKSQEKVARTSRRIGLGITGLADMFLMLGLRYGSPASLELARQIMVALRDTAYRTSLALAQEKGSFAGIDKIRYGASPFVLDLPHDIQDGIALHGIRNSHLLAVAPAGSISLLANNVSSGIEPVLAFQGRRRLRQADGQFSQIDVDDDAWRQYRALHGAQAALPSWFVQASDVSMEEQLRMMEAVQSCVDNAVSKTLHLRRDATLRDIGQAVQRAWALGLKGCTIYREGSRGGDAVLLTRPAS
jgi:ribonucleoside-diphosphate reductase alpha chain